ncbi:hypothetical protein ACH5RR_029921 [Cinchona calisaya]|uniref:Myb-like domain-containing protein n=1 Tax=Cinchona calisaya TaxID=153742 RepID=A0ABD2YWY1_9GENT
MEGKDSGKVVQSKKKFRLRWTKLLHDCFVKAVNQLGGAFEASPKDIVKVMGIKEITTNHIKSYLQRYRLSKEVYGTAYEKVACNVNTIQENEKRRNLARHTNEISRYIQPGRGKSPLNEEQTNFHKVSEEKAPKIIKRQNLQAKEATTTQYQLYHPATYNQPPNHPLRRCLTIYEAYPTIPQTQTATVEADYGYTSVNSTENKLHILKTAAIKPAIKSAGLLATTSSEEKELLSWPSVSMRDGFFVGKGIIKHQNYHDLTSRSVFQDESSKENKLVTTYERIDLNLSAQENRENGSID